MFKTKKTIDFRLMRSQKGTPLITFILMGRLVINHAKPFRNVSLAQTATAQYSVDCEVRAELEEKVECLICRSGDRAS